MILVDCVDNLSVWDSDFELLQSFNSSSIQAIRSSTTTSFLEHNADLPYLLASDAQLSLYNHNLIEVTSDKEKWKS